MPRQNALAPETQWKSICQSSAFCRETLPCGNSGGMVLGRNLGHKNAADGRSHPRQILYSLVCGTWGEARRIQTCCSARRCGPVFGVSHAVGGHPPRGLLRNARYVCSFRRWVSDTSEASQLRPNLCFLPMGISSNYRFLIPSFFPCPRLYFTTTFYQCKSVKYTKNYKK